MSIDLSNLRQVEEPTAEPVTYQEAAQHLREVEIEDIEDFPQSLVLPTYIQAARMHAESYTGLNLTDAIYQLRIDQFCGPIPLPIAPVSDVISVHYVDQEGALQELDDSTYLLDDHPTKPCIRTTFGNSWPTTRCEANAVRVMFRGPYSLTDSPPVQIPATVKQAMLLLMAHWYENREDVVVGATLTEVPNAARALLSLNRRNMGV